MAERHVGLVRAGSCQTTAVSPGLRGSGWLPLLQQQAALRCLTDALAPVYCQYALGPGLVMCRYEPAPEGLKHGHVVRSLFFSVDDLATLADARPLRADALLDWGERAEQSAPLSALYDGTALQAGLDQIESLLSEWLLERLLMALRGAARDKRLSVRIVMSGGAAAVAEKGRLLMDTLMRALPFWDMLRLSWCVTPSDEAALPCDVLLSPPRTGPAAETGAIIFDLTSGDMYWPGGAPTPDQAATDMARALMRGDGGAVDRLRRGQPPEEEDESAPAGREAPPVRRTASLENAFDRWAETARKQRAALNREAYAAYMTAQWPKQIDEIIRAEERMPRWAYFDQLSAIIAGLGRGKRGGSLNVTRQVLSDLSAVLLDSTPWDDIDLTNPDHLNVTRRAMNCVEYLEDGACGEGCLLASRVMRALCDMGTASVSDMIADLGRLCGLQVTVYGAIQACARRYFDRRCEKTRRDEDEFYLADEMLVGAALIVWSRFEGGIPDFRLLDLARDAVEAAGGPRQARRFSLILDRLRRRMHQSRSSQPRKREMRVMLVISLLLALIILAVVLGYFLFLR